MNIALVEDEMQWCERINQFLCDYYKEDIPPIDVYLSGEEFKKCTKAYSIILMDIELGKENGFELSVNYQKDFPEALIIVLTTHTELSRMGYRINAFRYIDKLHLEDLEEALFSASKRLRQQKRISVYVIGGGYINIMYEDIVYVEAATHNVFLCTREGIFECREKISDLHEKMREDGFYLIHRAYLVNMDHVKRIDSKGVEVVTGHILPISRRKMNEFRNNYVKWKLERANG